MIAGYQKKAIGKERLKFKDSRCRKLISHANGKKPKKCRNIKMMIGYDNGILRKSTFRVFEPIFLPFFFCTQERIVGFD